MESTTLIDHQRVIWASARAGFHHTTRHHPEQQVVCRETPAGPDLDITRLYRFEGRVAVLVHGYRSTLGGVEGAYSRMTDQLLDNYDYIVKFLWPGSWEVALGFLAANIRTTESGRRLAAVLRYLHPSEVHVWGHSLGCKVALEAVDRLPDEHQRNTRLILAAPAVPWHVLAGGARYGTLKTDTRVAWSRRDPVLGGAYRLSPGNWTTPALGHSGMRPGGPPAYFRTHTMDFTEQVDSHGGYRDHQEFYRFGLTHRSLLRGCVVAPGQVSEEAHT